MRTKGGIVAHFPAMRGHDGYWRTPVKADGKGFLDLLIIYRRHVFAIEVKGDGDKVRPEQDRWIDAWMTVPGATVAVITSKDWKNGVVESLLKEAEEW